MALGPNGVDLEHIGEFVEAVKADPEEGRARFLAHSHWKGGTQTEVHITEWHAGGRNRGHAAREFTMMVDEPPQLGGKDTAPNPVEYLAAGLCGCLTGGIATNAALFGTELEKIEVLVEADFDLRGVLGLHEAAPNGAVELRYTVKLKGPGHPDKLTKSKEVIDVKSPVRNTLELPLKITCDTVIEE